MFQNLEDNQIHMSDNFNFEDYENVEENNLKSNSVKNFI